MAVGSVDELFAVKIVQPGALGTQDAKAISGGQPPNSISLLIAQLA